MGGRGGVRSRTMQPPNSPQLASSLGPVQHQQSDEFRMLCIGINLAWKKLDEYYLKTDQSVVHVTAVVLHPSYTWKWLEKAWHQRQDWLTDARQKVRQFWLDNYAQLDIDEVEQQQAKEDATAWMDANLSDFSDSDYIPSGDECSRWCNEGRVSELHPLNFWNSP